MPDASAEKLTGEHKHTLVCRYHYLAAAKTWPWPSGFDK